ncbi:MAG: hypothetical protein R3E32_07985 [Chitinophagales bacterium]
MYKTFHIPKEANTYADTLEAYGLSHLLMAIFESQAMSNEVTINDKGIYFEIISKKAITSEIIDNLKYFQVVKFIQKDEKNKPPEHLGQEFYNYPLQRDLRREKRKEIEKAVKDFKGEDYSKQRKLIEEKYQSEKVAQPLVDEYDIFAQLVSNPYAAFLKLHGNFDNNQAHFKTLISEVLNLYLSEDNQIPTEYKALSKAKKINVEEKATMLQLINPNQGKGSNKAKATGMSVGNLKGSWIKETMKVSGALNFGMICQAVKVGSSYDMKVFVPLFSETKLNDKMAIMKDFKRTAKSNTPIKLDIVNTLKIIELFLKKSEKNERRKVKEHLLGLHSVYQKDLGQNKAVVNIAFLETPDFIDLADKEDWLEIIEEQKKLMNGITEQGDAMIGLLAYRNFLNGSNINEYFKFHYWYAPYLMHELNKKQTYVTTNKIETLNKIFTLMDISFKEIIENEGFQSVAAAIRKSTVSLQYTPKGERKFDVQYGLAQKLQNKSKSKDDLVTFIGEFIGKYNSDTARQREKTGQNLRANVKDKELLAFFELADNVNSKVLGAMLAAYGFALNKKDKETTEE